MRETEGPTGGAHEPEQASATPADPVVIVETDASQQGYDSQLALWWEQAKRANILPFPREHGISRAAMLRDYVDVAVDAAADAALRFRLRLPRAAQTAQRGADPQRLARFLLGAPGTEITIDGQRVPQEERLAPWLDRWLERRRLHPVSNRPRPTEAGIMGDVLATWQGDADIFVGRFGTVRFGESVFVVGLRSPVEHYRSIAHDYVLARSSLARIERDAAREQET